MKRVLLLLVVWVLSSCSVLGHHKTKNMRSTGLVSFLYPDGNLPQENARPHLKLPLNVGLAFVPESHHGPQLSQAFQQELLQSIQSNFADKHYVNQIKIIPSMYLKHGGKRASLDYLKQMFAIDVVALVSYDHITRRSQNITSLAYLTVVGGFIFKGTEFDSSTMVDLALVEIETKKMLLRAAGVAQSRARSTDSQAKVSYDQLTRKNFTSAMSQMNGNLAVALTDFEMRLRNKEDESIKVSHRPGYKMQVGGLMWLLLMGWVLCRRRTTA